MPAVHCSKCGKALEEIGVPRQIRLAQRYRQVINIGSESVSEEIKRDPFVYRGFFCTASRTAAASPIKRPLWVSIFAGLLAQWSLAGAIEAVGFGLATDVHPGARIVGALLGARNVEFSLPLFLGSGGLVSSVVLPLWYAGRRAVQRAAERPRVSGSDSPRSRPRPTSPSLRAAVFG
jgi:hypothetical protein